MKEGDAVDSLNSRPGRRKQEKTVMSRIPLSLHSHLSKLGNVRNLIIKACSKQYGYNRDEVIREENKIENPFL